MTVGGKTTDRELVQSFQQGDRSAYDQIYGRYRDRVYAICFRMLGRRPEAEEAAQETFLRAYQALGRFNGNYQVGAWLARIAANVSVDVLRARSRTTVVALPDDLESLETDQSPEEVVVGDHPRLEAAIDSIQPLHASALHLRAVQGLSHQEMAHHLAMSPAQVKALLHRARASLRRAWDRVEGMALVPILFLRHLNGDRGGHANLVGATPAFTPALAEKVAASAVVVVTVLAGAPSAPPVSSEPVAGGGRRVAAVGEQTNEPAELRAGTVALAPGTTEDAKGDVALLPDLDLDVEVDLPEQRAPKQKDAPDDDDDGDSGPPANGADADEVRREVRKVVTAVHDTLSGS